MTYQDLHTAIRELPDEERAQLLRALRTSPRDEQPSRRTRGASADHVRGMVRTAGVVPTDSELTDTYASYLIEKYT